MAEAREVLQRLGVVVEFTGVLEAEPRTKSEE